MCAYKTRGVGGVGGVFEFRALSMHDLLSLFHSLLDAGHHPKWRDVNLAAELPGWHRYPAAEQWLQRNMQVANTPKPDDLRLMFARFIDERRQATGSPALPQQDKDLVFQQFQSWQKGQTQ